MFLYGRILLKSSI